MESENVPSRYFPSSINSKRILFLLVMNDGTYQQRWRNVRYKNPFITMTKKISSLHMRMTECFMDGRNAADEIQSHLLRNLFCYELMTFCYLLL